MMGRSTSLVLLVAAVLLGLAFTPRPASAQRKHTTCSYCHSLHGTTGNALTDFETAETLCLSCHELGGTAPDGKTIPVMGTAALHDGVKHTGGDVTSCRDCHDHEGEAGSNLRLIPSQMESRYTGTKTVVFEDRPTDFADGNTTLDGVCEVCHQNTNFHQHDQTACGQIGHQAQQDCTTCHTHESGFAAPAVETACIGCHTNAQPEGCTGPDITRRAVVGEFSRISRHVDPADLQNADCAVCHDMSQHTQGSVRLTNVDGGATVALTGDPQSVSTEAAKLTLFCLACHDDNGTGSATPFSGSVVVPLIDSALWDVASHNTAPNSTPRSCFGDGQFGCHATGHGSERTPLLGLNPGTSPASGGDPLYYQEEGFCFNCHNRSAAPTGIESGTAADTVEYFFDVTRSAIRWAQEATGVNADTNLNDRHDVQYSAQLRSGWKIECVDCHDPHVATAAQPWRADPDPSDGRTPTAGASWTGSTLMSEFCMDCHDGSFRSTITVSSTSPREDIRTEWSDSRGAKMGSGSGNGEDLEPPTGGWGYVAKQTLDCLDCHATHIRGRWANNNLFQLKDTVYSADGSTRVPTDDGSFNYRVTDVTPPGTDVGAPVNGWNWCNTCHESSMSNWGTNCMDHHAHSDRF